MADDETTDLERRIRAMPKFEIHVHVEGACDPDTYWALAARNGIELPHDDLASFRRWFDFVDFDHFVDVYVTAVNLLQSPADFRFLIESFHEHQARQDIVYSEAFLSATYIAGRFEHDAMIDAITQGLERGRERHGVEVRLIPDIARHEPASQRPVLDFVKRGFDRGVFLGPPVRCCSRGMPSARIASDWAGRRRDSRRSSSRRASRRRGTTECTWWPTRARARGRRASGARWRRSAPSASATGCGASRTRI